MSYEEEQKQLADLMDVVAGKMKTMSPTYASVAAAIPYGRESARTVAEIVMLLNLTGDARRRVNSIVEDLVFLHDLPVGGSSDTDTKGIFYCVDREDVILASHTLNSRAMRTLERHRKLNDNYTNLVKGKPDLEGA